MNKHFRAPLSFHNNAPSTHRPRHRNRHVNSLLAVDASGKEHLLLNFYVQGCDPSAVSAPPGSESLVNRVYDWTASKTSSISELTYDEALQWAKDASSHALQASRRAFAYLIGEPLPPLPQPTLPLRREIDNGPNSKESSWSLSGIFTRLTGQRRGGGDRRSEALNGTVYSTGEVHADFVKVRLA